jgi:hypothetical protein
MITRSNIRGNGAQLSWYLTALNENDHVEILEIDGRESADELYLDQVIMGMQFNSELTKTDKAYFNVQINPAYGEDKAMSREDWYLAADIIAKETGFENQRRVIVLHTKKDRTHAHVVWERYNHDTGKMIDNKQSRIKVNIARSKIEQALNQKPTPHRNVKRPELREAVTKIWNNTETGAEFLKQTRMAGYMVAEGNGNRPFMIVDETGVSTDLVRQIQGVRTKEVRARLGHEKLMPEKQAIDYMREQGAAKSGKRERQSIDHTMKMQAASSFAENRTDAVLPTQVAINNKIIADFSKVGKTVTEPQPPVVNDDAERKQKVAAQFAENREPVQNKEAELDEKRQKIVAQQERIKERNRQKKPRR